MAGCAFPGCARRATRYESVPLLLYAPHAGPIDSDATIRAFCDQHYGQDECPCHTASESDRKVCGKCGIHIDELRYEEPEE